MEIARAALILAIFGLYLLPALIAFARNTGHLGAIAAVNLLLGWTVLGWIAAVIWACVETPARSDREEPIEPWSPEQEKAYWEKKL